MTSHAEQGPTSHAKVVGHEERAERKHRVLSQGTAAVVRSIAEAVVVKDLDLFFLCRPDGSVPLGGAHGFGLCYHDCRFLDGYELKVAGATVNPLAASAGAGNRAILELTNADIRMADDRVIPKDAIGITWTRRIDGQRLVLDDEIAFTNYAPDRATFDVQLTVEARFEDLFQVRGLWREDVGSRSEPTHTDDELTFRYLGGDGVARSTTLKLSPAPASLDARSARFELDVAPGKRAAVHVRVTVDERLAERGRDDTTRPDEPAARPFASRPGRRRQADWLRNETRVESDNVLLSAVVNRSFSDLRTLRSIDSSDQYFAAGVPWFVALFGRDSLITALQVLAYDRDVATETLRLLADRQGTKEDDWRDEQPGKILHELRVGEYARMGKIPQDPYYGTIDATPLFLILLGRHAAWSGSLDLFRELRSHVDAALDWMDRNTAEHGGYLAYDSRSGKGLANQGWKDSGDAIVNRDGSLARPPIALVEVQGYAYEAKVRLADLFERDGDGDRAGRLRADAADLRKRFNRDFWTGDETGYALALQRDGEPCAVVASNPGQAMATGIVDEDHARRTAELLMDRPMFTGWGIRTFAEGQRRYNPIGYHLGTVWPHDNSLIAAGFRRYRLDDQATTLFESLLEAAMRFGEYRLPETFGGFRRADFGVPVRYPVACHPQAWAAGSVPYLLATVLGLEADAFSRRLRIVRPSLPAFLDCVELHGLRVGEASASLRFSRRGDGIVVDTLALDGDLDVAVDAPA